MAAALCTEWATMEGFVHSQQPPPVAPFAFIDPLPFSSEATHLPVMDHLDGGATPDDYLMVDDPFDADFYSCLFPSFAGAIASHDQLDLCTPSSLISGGNLFDDDLVLGSAATVTNAITGATTYRHPRFPFSPLEYMEMETMQLQRPVVAAAAEKTLSSEFGCSNGGRCPTAQSAAARQRRKRISEKTQELGQLIPGGGSMHTAEMLQAAFSYVKFLQAQVGVLGVMDSFQQEELEGRTSTEASGHRLLRVLMASPTTQGKLAAEERCVMPTRFVRALAEDREIKGHPSISRELNGFMASMGW